MCLSVCFGDRSNVGHLGTSALNDPRRDIGPVPKTNLLPGSRSKPGRLAYVGKASRLTSSVLLGSILQPAPLWPVRSMKEALPFPDGTDFGRGSCEVGGEKPNKTPEP